MESCIICYDEDINLILPPYCNCKCYLHLNCYEIMKNKMFILCPMCRKKIIKNIIIIEVNLPNYSRTILCLILIGLLLIILFFILFLLFIKNGLIIIPYFITYYIFF
jgi:hypothetical protein